MVDRINGSNPFENGIIPTGNQSVKNNSQADNIFNNIDKNKDGVLSQEEASAFGFSTLGNTSLTRSQFAKKFELFKNKTGSLGTMLEDFGDVFYKDADKDFIHDVKLSPNQQKELLSRMEMFDAYYSSLTESEKEELLKIKSDMMCFNAFRKDGPIPEGYELPGKTGENKPSSIKGLPDYQYTQIKDFMSDEYKQLKAELKEGKEDYTVSNAMLSKYLKLASVNDIESDGKIGGFRQGSVGDCWFLSELETYAADPEGEKNIKDRIKKNNDGSYTILFNNPFDQTQKEPISVSAEEMENYRKFHTNIDKNYSSGDVDVRAMEIAANKLLEKYVPEGAVAEGDLPIEGSSYLKESIMHRALGYTNKVEYFDIDNDVNSQYHEKIINMYGDITLDESGKAKIENPEYYCYDGSSLIELAKNENLREDELICGSISDESKRATNDKNNKKFMNNQHAYNIMKVNEDEIVVSNPHYASFPHVVKKELFEKNFFDHMTYFPKDDIITIDKCKD